MATSACRTTPTEIEQEAGTATAKVTLQGLPNFETPEAGSEGECVRGFMPESYDYPGKHDTKRPRRELCGRAPEQVEGSTIIRAPATAATAGFN